MTERPIIFTAENVPRVLDGSKTQTRRIMTPQPRQREETIGYISPELTDGPADIFRTWLDRTAEGKSKCEHDFNAETWRCPYGVPGDRLWIKEAWCVGLPALPSGEGLRPILGKLTPELRAERMKRAYKASWDGADQPPWRSGRFMPKWAARPERLEIVRVGVERLQEISEADAEAEGAPLVGDNNEGGDDRTYYDGFMWLWDSINGKRYPSHGNPYVWVIEWPPVKS